MQTPVILRSSKSRKLGIREPCEVSCDFKLEFLIFQTNLHHRSGIYKAFDCLIATAWHDTERREEKVEGEAEFTILAYLPI